MCVKISIASYLIIGILTGVFLLLITGYFSTSSLITKVNSDIFIENTRIISRLVTDMADMIPSDDEGSLVAFMESAVLSRRVTYIDAIKGGVRLSPPLLSKSKFKFIEDSEFSDHGDSVYFTSHVLHGDSGASDRPMPSIRPVTVLRIGFDETPVLDSINEARSRLIAFCAAFMAVTSLVVALLSRSLTRPIRDLSRMASGITAGDFHQSIHVNTIISELHQLGIHLHKMLSSLVHQADSLEKLSHSDTLTGIPNRLVLNTQLDNAVATGERHDLPFSLMILDLDQFKEVNDTLGHQAGDAVLKEAALRLQRSIRKGDTVARLGGDEFAVLFFAADKKDLEKRCRTIADVIREPYNIDDTVVRVGISMGVAGYQRDEADSDELIRRADMSMYHAKKNGLDYFFYDSKMDKDELQKNALRKNLNGLLDRKELVMYYQPKMNLSTGTLDSFEALVRWEHPEKGLLGPGVFLPLIERTELIHDMTYWVLSQSMKDCEEWKEFGYPVGLDVAVNISPKSLSVHDFSVIVNSLIDTISFNPEKLELELTENDLIKDPATAAEVLGELASNGIKIAIDDFGQGYSSLAYLKQLPIDTVKIDKAFILNLHDDDDNGSIVKSTIDMVHTLGIKVTAEGIENERALRHLIGWGCDFGQGFLFGRPMPQSKILHFIETLEEESNKLFKNTN